MQLKKKKRTDGVLEVSLRSPLAAYATTDIIFRRFLALPLSYTWACGRNGSRSPMGSVRTEFRHTLVDRSPLWGKRMELLIAFRCLTNPRGPLRSPISSIICGVCGDHPPAEPQLLVWLSSVLFERHKITSFR